MHSAPSQHVVATYAVVISTNVQRKARRNIRETFTNSPIVSFYFVCCVRG